MLDRPGPHPTEPVAAPLPLDAPGRLAALRAIGTGPSADPDLQRFARLVASTLHVPVALVSVVEQDRQVFPGQVGLPEPWASARCTPLSHSFCQHVATTAEPLVISDARTVDLVRDNLAIPELGVVAYAGMPLTAEGGEVLGSLCAIDHEPRVWTPTELEVLADLAAACSAALRLKVSGRRTADARREVDRGRERAELMLQAAVELGEVWSLTDLLRRVRDLVTGPLHPVFVGLSLVDGEHVVRVEDPTWDEPVTHLPDTVGLDASWPEARCVAEQRRVIVAGPEQLVADGYSADALAAWRELDLRALECVPVLGSGRALGALTFGWDAPHAWELTEDAVLTAIAAYTATAVERILQLERRVTTATELQEAMLSEPPAVAGLEVATLYRPSSTADMVGGDWYDVHELPPLAPGGPRPVAVTVGDITGHDTRAAAVMGQVRSMLRQARADAPGAGPARAVLAVENAARMLGLEAHGTVVHGDLVPGADGWTLRWTNAGHPPPLVLAPDGTARVLLEGDPFLYPDLEVEERHDHHVHLAPGTLLLVHTDGLLDERRVDLAAMVEEVRVVFARLVHDEGRPLTEAVHLLADEMLGGRAEDDVAILAVRVR
ncbi:GAF domain-containing protein [Nocardioides zeae]|uniref:GAF domain-containing protein n=1 Tax=Nocardioides zeae TaxID=1457234 RepID=A0ACC6IJ54_9ACTN|nr:SpoIIE family protein phosphatase [Nocardioides zeae]MDR6174630.1 GAF domain-containing protein [Nocardioides zeae]MDR6210700.1 GAF domain-containing protein [Nocardioides zeae]